MGKNAKPNGESPRDRFLRLAPPRTDAAIKKISLLGNLANTGYDYQPNEVRQIVDALENAVADVKQKFTRKKETTKKSGFTFRHVSAA